MSEMIEVCRNSVQSWEIDQMGHMNVQFYMDKAQQGLAAFSTALGFGPSQVRAAGAQLLPLDHHVRFLREQRPGAPFFLRAGFLGHTAHGLRIYEEMVNTASGDVAATFSGEVALLDDMTRQIKPMPDAMRKAAEGFAIDLPAHGAPRGLTLYEPRPAPVLDQAIGMGMVPTYQGMVQPAQCDGQGRLGSRHFMGLVSDSIPNLLAQTQGGDRSKSPKVGGAALEYRFIYRRFPVLGDVLVLRSGLKEVMPKTYTWCHWLFDFETGEAVATAEAVAIALDLETRRSIPIPDEMRENLGRLVIGGLGV